MANDTASASHIGLAIGNMKDAGLTMEQIAKVIGVSPATLYRYASGETEPTHIAVLCAQSAAIAVLALQANALKVKLS
jgi:transcriptional regulator with XRE-family HTH domain